MKAQSSEVESVIFQAAAEPEFPIAWIFSVENKKGIGIGIKSINNFYYKIYS